MITQVDTKNHTCPVWALTSIFPKPLSFVRRLVEASTVENAIVLDCYGGSGTTAHAVVDINREDGNTAPLRDYRGNANYFEKTLHLRVEKGDVLT